MSDENHLPIVCLDFDGVLHSYASGWQGAAVIPDDPVPGAREFVVELQERARVHILSSRSLQYDRALGINGRAAMAWWLISRLGLGLARIDTHDLGEFAEWPEELYQQFRVAAEALEERHPNPIRFPTEKPPALVTLDGRAVCFDGAWPDVGELLAFRPWNSSEVATWVPPVNTIEQVLYGGRQHNETPIGLFSSSVPRARNAPPPKKEADTIHHCRRKDGELHTARGDASRRQRGAHYGPIIAALEAHGALTVREIHRELGGRVDAGRISDALGIMAKHGEAQHDGQGTRSRWWLT